MATTVKVIKIDTDYIRKYMKEGKKRLDLLSKDMGHAHDFMGQRLSAGQMSATDFKLMCLLTGMKEEDAKAKKKEEPVTPQINLRKLCRLRN